MSKTDFNFLTLTLIFRATHIVKENGVLVKLNPQRDISREAIAKTLLTPPSELVGGRPVTGTKKVPV